MSTFALVCIILSMLAYTLYVSVVYTKYKPSCISESYYLIKKPWLFTVWMLLVSFLIFPAWVEISPINFLFLPFLSVVSLSVVGLSPRYLETDRKAHIIGTACAAVLSIIWNIATGMYIIPLIFVAMIILLFLAKIKNSLFWTENLAFSNIYLSTIFL